MIHQADGGREEWAGHQQRHGIVGSRQVKGSHKSSGAFLWTSPSLHAISLKKRRGGGGILSPGTEGLNLEIYRPLVMSRSWKFELPVPLPVALDKSVTRSRETLKAALLINGGIEDPLKSFLLDFRVCMGSTASDWIPMTYVRDTPVTMIIFGHLRQCIVFPKLHQLPAN